VAVTTGRPWGWIAAGGAAGAAVRWAVATTFGGGGGFPVQTWAVNVVGCLLLGVLLALGAARRLGQPWADALGVGFCGGLTTFSTLTVEVVDLADRGRAALAVAYVAASAVAGVAAFVVGGRLAERRLAEGRQPEGRQPEPARR
jgi:CrcB protein